ncbi:MAG: hypothetical protein M1480_07565 [Bacteroidetes bacterium]|nr:hypothetical protein [Bacteroidota bacterium]
MEIKYFLMLINFILFFQVIGCNESVVPPQESRKKIQLIINPSFEEYGRPSLRGWKCPEAPLLKIQMVAPPGGQFYSIFLKSRDVGAVASTVVAAVLGNHIYKLSVWGRVTRLSALMQLFYKHSDSLSIRKSVSISSAKWNQYIVYDTVSASHGDSLIVALSGTISSSPPPYTWFDVCELEVED